MTATIADQDFTLLSRYLDGELDPKASRELEARLRREAELGTAFLRMQELNHRIHDAFAERDAVREDVMNLLLPASEAPLGAGSSPGREARVLQFPGNVAAPGATTRPPWMFAAAASVTLAVAVAFLAQDGNKAAELPGNDRFVSAALDSHLSGEGWTSLGDGREFQAVLSFPHQDGGWCREYLLRGKDANWRAVACRESDRWVTQAAGNESFLESNDAYRPAGAGDSQNVAVFISQNAADIALGLSEEQALIQSGWTRQ